MMIRTLALLAALVGASTFVWQETPSTDGRGTTFGYRIGEERRYVQGPPESLWNGESATWGVALDRVATVGTEAATVFRLWHERRAAGSPTAAGGPDGLETRVDGELTVNSHGFPLLLRFTVRRQIDGGGAEEFSVRYAYEDGHFLKTVWAADTDWTITIPLSGHQNLDDSVPMGLYLFSLSATGCMIPEYVDPQYDAFFVENSSPCDNHDPALLNPGLLGLALPAFWGGGAKERGYLFFTPTGPDLYTPGTGRRSTLPSFRSGLAGQAGAGSDAGDIDTATDRKRYYQAARARLGERTRIELGRRRVDAWRLVLDGPIGEIFVDDEDRVLRASLPPHPVSGESRWIRLLLPTEY